MKPAAQVPSVLIVDDDKGLARLIEKALVRDGCSTAIALSGEEAIAWLKDHHADLMLLDLKLPDLHGKELIDRLEVISRAVPFIIITGQGDERVAVDMMKRGALDYLVKDVQFLEFVPTVVRRSLAQLDREKRLAEAEVERERLEQEILAISDREQRRVGQDLHDGLFQVLAGVEMLTHVLQGRLAQTSARDAADAAKISRYVRQAIDQARMLARGLSPVGIETHGLMSSLQELAKDISALFNIVCELRCDEPVLIDDHAKATHLFRIAQEAINNAIKHGKAGRIDVALSKSEEVAMLRVTDDGGGFQAKSDRTNGMGLRTMKYRAGVIGARLEIHPAKPRGTAVMCTFTVDSHRVMPARRMHRNP